MIVDYTDLENPTLIAARDELNEVTERIMLSYPTLRGPQLKMLIDPCENEICTRYGINIDRLMHWVHERLYRDIKSSVVARQGQPADWEGIALKISSEIKF